MHRGLARSILFVGVVAGAGALAVACGLGENGLGPPEDGGGTPDGGASADVLVLPEACASLDAACLGVLPQGWQPVAVGGPACAGGYQSVSLVTNPGVPDGGCACGACAVVGAYSCEASVPVSGGNNCGDNPFASATPGQCTDVSSTQHLKAHVVQATGSVGCSAPNDAGTGAATDALTVCVPGCGVDFCGGASRCAMAEGHVDCPPGLTLQARVGTGADPGCAPCGCDASAPGSCTGDVTAFYNPGCVPGDEAGTWGIDTCQYIQSKYQSVFVSLTAPPASCTVASSTVGGDASLVGEKTICCK